MIDLQKLCADLKNERSGARQEAGLAISGIFSFLSRPSEKTALLLEGWRQDFAYLYGSIDTNLSSNSKLSVGQLLEGYGIQAAGGADALQLLFFSLQTYFSILIKYIMRQVLQGIREETGFSHTDILLGGFARSYGIENYCGEDWYCWPVFELENGFDAVMDGIDQCLEAYRSAVSAAEFQVDNSYDLIKQIYEAVIPKELRHALGEYYTPDWLAEAALDGAVQAAGVQDIAGAVVMDPTCGSGTFLLQAIAYKRRHGAGLDDILRSVYGIDINPLAVLTAKTNYILSVLDLMDGEKPFSIPVFQADIMELARDSVPEGPPEGRADFLRAAGPAEAVRSRGRSERRAAGRLPEADILAGNPPWVNWEYMPEKYRKDSQGLWLDYRLFQANGPSLSFSKEDVSVLITCIVMDRFLKDRGVIGFVIRQGVFKSAKNGAGFRKFTIRDETPVKVLRVEDLSRIKAFEGAASSTALFFARKGEETRYPVPYGLWEKRDGVKGFSFSAYSPLREVMGQIAVRELCARPAVKGDRTSLWMTAEKDRLDMMEKILGTNSYRARTGVFTGGANAVYWLQINGVSSEGVSVTNVVRRAKRKSEQVTCELEPAYVYPMLRGGNVSRWNTVYDTYLLCPHTEETKIRPVPERELAETAPKTLRYLKHFRRDLDSRSGFAGWEKELQRQAFHAILRIGAYTFSRYKVIWRYIASEFICAVISTVNDPYLGEKLLLPNEKIMYISTDSADEAYYLCGLLSSSPVTECVRSYMNPMSISAHVLDKLNIPRFDRGNALHMQIAAACKSGHGKKELEPYIAEVDRLATELYQVV